MMLRPLNPREFEQGTIFTCALSEAYPAATAYGMLITARCDTAQHKTDVYNYLPLIPVADWIIRDGFNIIAKRILNNELASRRKILEEAGMAPSILDFVGIDEIKGQIDAEKSKHSAKLSQRLENSSKLISGVEALLADKKISKRAVIEFINDHETSYKSVIKDLLSNNISEFQYLERCEIGEDARGYVLLLREIRFLSAKLGKRIAIGIDHDEFRQLTRNEDSFPSHVKFTEDQDFAMPLSCITSPHIEFIIQRFVNLFSRVGVAEVSKEKFAEASLWIKRMGDEV